MQARIFNRTHKGDGQGGHQRAAIHGSLKSDTTERPELNWVLN